MSIPDYESLMILILERAADGQEHVIGEVIAWLADYFGLTDEERREMLPSGRQPRFDNRVYWARTYLIKAGLLQSTGWGRFRITERGLEVLDSSPPAIDLKFLEQFPEFAEWRFGYVDEPKADGSAPEQTPDESLEASYGRLRSALAQELVERVLTTSPQFFEKLVVDLLVAMGYAGARRDAAKAIGQTGDGGVDGVLKSDRLGLDVVYVQAKRWEPDSTVGRPAVQAFAGSLEGFKARKGVFITTSRFSKEAQEYVEKIEKKIVLIDGEQLAQFMIDYSIGVAEVVTYTVKQVDAEYFGGE